MRIGVFLDQSFPPDSRVENEAYSLTEAGHSVDLFSLNFKNLTPSFEEVNGIRVHRIEVSRIIYKLSALAYTFPFFHFMLRFAIKGFINEVKPEVLHIHDMLIAKAVMDVNDKYFHLPVVLDLHENRPEILRFYPHLQKFPGKYMISIDKWRKAQSSLIERANHVVMVTPEAIQDAVSETNKELSSFTAVANTIEPDIYYSYTLDENIKERFSGKFNIVYVGDTGLRRGLDTSIEMLEILMEKIPEINLIVVGRSTQDDVLRNLVDQKGLNDKVIFEGWQDVSLFPSYIESADVCISPLHRNRHHDTTLANKIFQYMAGAKPLVVSDCPSQVKIIQDAGCGLVFEAQNAEDMAQQILELHQNPSLAKEMGDRGKRSVADKYNWKVTAQDLIKLYAKF